MKLESLLAPVSTTPIEDTAHRLAIKRLKAAGFEVLPYDGEGVDVRIGIFKVVIVYFQEKEQPWRMVFIREEDYRVIERYQRPSFEDVLRILNRMKEQEQTS